jgi:DNA modification methylase
MIKIMAMIVLEDLKNQLISGDSLEVLGKMPDACLDKNLKRQYLGIEINPDYVSLAKVRLKQADYIQELFI